MPETRYAKTEDGVHVAYQPVGDGLPSPCEKPCGASGSKSALACIPGEVEHRGDDVGGITVHIAARVTEAAGAGDALVSRTVADLVAGSEVQLADRGEHEVKGIPDRWRLFAADL